MTTRKCKKCDVEKCILDFAFDSRKSSYTDVCKECKRKTKKNELDKIRKNFPEKLRLNL